MTKREAKARLTELSRLARVSRRDRRKVAWFRSGDCSASDVLYIAARLWDTADQVNAEAIKERASEIGHEAGRACGVDWETYTRRKILFLEREQA